MEKNKIGSNEIILNNPLSEKEKRILENLRLELLEDLTEFGINTKIALIFKEYKDEYYFTDYDVYDNQTIIENDEAYKIVTIKEALYFICDIMYPGLKKDVICLWIHLWIQDTSAYALSKELNLSKQFIYNILNGVKPLPNKYKEPIANFLKFDINEFENIKTQDKIKFMI